MRESERERERFTVYERASFSRDAEDRVYGSHFDLLIVLFVLQRDGHMLLL